VFSWQWDLQVHKAVEPLNQKTLGIAFLFAGDDRTAPADVRFAMSLVAGLCTFSSRVYDWLC
jgi:hypothetical protein